MSPSQILSFRVGRADGQVVSALRSWLSGADPGLRSRAAELLEKLGRAAEQVVSTLVTAIDSAAADAIHACQKLYRGTWLTEHEAKSLATLAGAVLRQLV